MSPEFNVSMLQLATFILVRNNLGNGLNSCSTIWLHWGEHFYNGCF